MQVRPFPGPLTDTELELRKAAFKRLAFSAFPARRRVFRGDILEEIPDQTRHRRVSFDRYFTDLFDELIIERERDVHVHIISETLISCKGQGPDRVHDADCAEKRAL